MLSIDEINKLQKDLELEHNANQRYSELLIEYGHKIEKYETALKKILTGCTGTYAHLKEYKTFQNIVADIVREALNVESSK